MDVAADQNTQHLLSNLCRYAAFYWRLHSGHTLKTAEDAAMNG
jgi:hypothetical protein